MPNLTNQLVKEAFHSIPKCRWFPDFISSDKVVGRRKRISVVVVRIIRLPYCRSVDAGSLEIWTDVDGFMTAIRV